MHLIGLKNIKIVIAVTICLLLKVFLMFFFEEDEIFNWYTPFFAGIAAAYSVSIDVKSSVRQAKIRSVGSIIGGFYGILIVMLVENAIDPALGSLANNHFVLYTINYLVYSVAIIGAILLAQYSRQSNATFITCLTYLSVTVSIRNGGQPVIMFGINRILSTIIGVFIAVLVNAIKFPKRKNQNILFVNSLDGLMLDDHYSIPAYTKLKLNYLIKEGAKVAFATTRTPSSLNRIFDGINLNLPTIIMDGAAVYDFGKDHYSHVYSINQDVISKINEYFSMKKINAFTHVIKDDMLYIYYQELANEMEIDFYNTNKNAFFDSYLKLNIPDDSLICYYVLIRPNYEVEGIVKDLKELCDDSININIIPYHKGNDYSFLKIHNGDVNKENALVRLGLEDKADMTVSFGSKEIDIPILNNSDLSICLDNAPDEVKAVCDYIIPHGCPDKVVSLMAKLYFRKKYFDKIKKR